VTAWFNCLLGQPDKRSLVAYDRRDSTQPIAIIQWETPPCR
jgi:hypothetical protein